MGKYLLLTSLLLLSFSTLSSDLASFCEEKGGDLLERYKCPKTSFPLLTKICVFKNDVEEHHFTDGCTGPTGGHRDLFLKSCIKHDLCYHHEPMTSGKSRKDCDLEFRDDLLRSCQRADNYFKCERWAKTMFRALRIFGSFAFRCEKKAVSSYDILSFL